MRYRFTPVFRSLYHKMALVLWKLTLCVCLQVSLFFNDIPERWESIPGFSLRRFRDPIRFPRISNRVPRIREIGSLQIQTGFLTFSLKKNLLYTYIGVSKMEKIFYSLRGLFSSCLSRWFCNGSSTASILVRIWQPNRSLEADQHTFCRSGVNLWQPPNVKWWS